MTDVAMLPVANEQPRPRRRLRAAFAILLGILACIALIASTTVFWVHQVALSTDRWVALSANVASDPAVIQSVSEQVSQQTVVALDVEGRLASALPGNAQLLAGPIAASVQDRLQQTLADLLASPGFQQAWEEANRFAHRQLLAILRNDSTIVTLENGVVTLNLFPLVDAALRSLQAQGIIPASVTIPDLTAATAPEQARNALQSALGVTLPQDFGTIPLVRAERLETLRTAIRVFDLLVIIAFVLTVLLFVAAAFVSRDRRRAVILLGAGAVIALLIARGVIRGIENSIVGSVSDPVGATTARGVFDAVLEDLFGLMVLVSVIGGIVAILAWLFGRRDDIRRAAASANTAVRQATASGTEAGRAAVSGAAPTGLSIRDWVRAHLAPLRAAGIVVAVAWLATLAVGWEPVAIVGSILVLYEVGLGSLAERPSEAPSGSPAA